MPLLQELDTAPSCQVGENAVQMAHNIRRQKKKSCWEHSSCTTSPQRNARPWRFAAGASCQARSQEPRTHFGPETPEEAFNPCAREEREASCACHSSGPSTCHFPTSSAPRAPRQAAPPRGGKGLTCPPPAAAILELRSLLGDRGAAGPGSRGEGAAVGL